MRHKKYISDKCKVVDHKLTSQHKEETGLYS